MAKQYWAKMNCNGAGNVPGQFVEAGQEADFTANFNLPLGGSSVDCQICFQEYGVIGGAWTCVDAGSLQIPSRCVCSDLTTPQGAALQSSATCPEGKVAMGYAMGAAGQCYACMDCIYPEGDEYWTPLPSSVCDGITFTQTLAGTGQGCPALTRQAIGSKQPNWSPWSPDTDTVCQGVEMQQSRYDHNGCLADQQQQETGTAQEVWSDWYPNAGSVCEGETFSQYRDGYCNMDWQTRQAAGTAIPGWTEWDPPTSMYCEGIVFFQYRYSDCAAEYGYGMMQQREAVGAAAPGQWSEWGPPPESVCAGVLFNQTRSALDCMGAEEQRTLQGTLEPNWGAWTPDASTVCSGVQFIRSRSDQNAACEAQHEMDTGTKPSQWSEWGPVPDDVCEGVQFTQARHDASGCAADEQRQAVGKKPPVWSAWAPAADTFCVGENFSQYRYDSTGCFEGEMRVATGTAQSLYGQYPVEEEVCAGETFTYYRYDYCQGISTEGQSVGTLQPNFVADLSESSVCLGVQYTKTFTDQNGCAPDYTETAVGTNPACNAAEISYYWSDYGSLPAGCKQCESKQIASRTFINPFNAPASLYITGGVDDDVEIDGERVHDGAYMGSNCPGLAAAHNFSKGILVGPNGSTTITYFDNFCGSTGIEAQLRYVINEPSA